jgi:hypothetical protein
MKGCSKILHEVGGITKVARLRALVIGARCCALDASLRRPDAVNGQQRCCARARTMRTSVLGVRVGGADTVPQEGENGETGRTLVGKKGKAASGKSNAGETSDRRTEAAITEITEARLSGR